MISEFRRNIARIDVNRKGKKTRRKIVVIESDDWGSIRMPNRQVYKQMRSAGLRVDKNPYYSFDSLATPNDLEQLYDVLTSVKDANGNHPVITANTITSNPVFNDIEASSFKNYSFELFTDTLSRDKATEKSFETWKQGMDAGIFFPQFHGREHVNVENWLPELQNENSVLRTSFSYGCWYSEKLINGKINIHAAYDTEHNNALNFQKECLKEGLQQFKTIFGYASESFIAPNFIYHSSLNRVLHECGIKVIQGMKYQKHPVLQDDRHRLIRHVYGEENLYGQRYTVRNCVFEPSQMGSDFDNVGQCLNDIQSAFFWKKPAVITAHRLNFIGAIHPENRDSNLKQLRELLQHILKKWPDVEFIRSDQQLYSNGNIWSSTLDKITGQR